MRKILIVSHGNMSKGTMDTLNFITADSLTVDYIAAYTETSEDFEDLISEYFITNPDEEILIFSDMKNGSVNQKFIPYMNEYRHLISGFNLSLILSLALDSSNQLLSQDTIESAINDARNEMIYINTLNIEEEDDDE